MMRSGRRASLLVAFSLLTPAATAYAECAWVLWEQTQVGNLWAVAPIDAQIVFKEQRECEAWAEQRNQTHQKARATIGRMPERTWRCLPDTIDPRGPKGK